MRINRTSGGHLIQTLLKADHGHVAQGLVHWFHEWMETRQLLCDTSHSPSVSYLPYEYIFPVISYWNAPCFNFSPLPLILLLCTADSFLMVWSREDRVRALSLVPRDKTRGNGCKLEYMKFHYNLRIYFSYCECDLIIELRPTQTEESPSSGTFKTQLDIALSVLLSMEKILTQLWLAITN